jgi:cell division protein FtsB
VRIYFRFGRSIADARPARSAPSDARPSDGLLDRPQADPEADLRIRIRRGAFVFVLAVVFLAGSAAALFGEHGFLDVKRSRAELESLQQEVDEQLAEVLALKSEVKRLKNDPNSIERIAREELGLARRGEIQLLLPRTVPPEGGAGELGPSDAGEKERSEKSEADR